MHLRPPPNAVYAQSKSTATALQSGTPPFTQGNHKRNLFLLERQWSSFLKKRIEFLVRKRAKEGMLANMLELPSTHGMIKLSKINHLVKLTIYVTFFSFSHSCRNN